MKEQMELIPRRRVALKDLSENILVMKPTEQLLEFPFQEKPTTEWLSVADALPVRSGFYEVTPEETPGKNWIGYLCWFDVATQSFYDFDGGRPNRSAKCWRGCPEQWGRRRRVLV